MAFSDTFTALGNTIINLVNTRLKKDFSNIETVGEDKIKELSTYTVDGVPYVPGEYNVNSSSMYESPLFGMCPFSTSQYTDLQQYFMNSWTVPQCLLEIGQKIDISNVYAPGLDISSIGGALSSIITNIIGTNSSSTFPLSTVYDNMNYMVNDIIGTNSSSTFPLSTVYDNMNYMVNDMYGYWGSYSYRIDNNTNVSECVAANIGKRSDFTWDYFSVSSSTPLWEYANMVDDDLNSLQQAFDSVIQQLEEAANSTETPELPPGWDGGDEGGHEGVHL